MRGRGAVRTALEHAAGTSAAIMDADLECDPSDIEKLPDRVLKGKADVVFAARGFKSHSAFSFWYVMGNKGVPLAANLLFNSYLADIMTCHKVMRTGIFRALHLESRDRNRAAINSAGNPIHLTGIVWAGSYGLPIEAAPRAGEVPALSGGACLAFPGRSGTGSAGSPSSTSSGARLLAHGAIPARPLVS